MPYKVVNNHPVEAQSTSFLKNTEQYVVIMLNRRGQRLINGRPSYYKNGQPVAFPLQGLDLSPYFKNKGNNKSTYNLIAVVMHSGFSDNGGHYLAYTKRGSQWYLCNDSTVQLISSQEMATLASVGSKTRSCVPTTFIYELSNTH